MDAASKAQAEVASGEPVEEEQSSPPVGPRPVVAPPPPPATLIGSLPPDPAGPVADPQNPASPERFGSPLDSEEGWAAAGPPLLARRKVKFTASQDLPIARQSTLSIEELFSDVDFDCLDEPPRSDPIQEAAESARRLGMLVEQLSSTDSADSGALAGVLDAAKSALAREGERIEGLDATDPKQADARQQLLDAYFSLQRAIDKVVGEVSPEGDLEQLSEALKRPGTRLGVPRIEATPAASAKFRLRRAHKMLIALAVLVGLRIWLEVWLNPSVPSASDGGFASVAQPNLVARDVRQPPTAPQLQRNKPMIHVVALAETEKGLNATVFAVDPKGRRLKYAFTWMTGKTLVAQTEIGLLPADQLTPGLKYHVEAYVSNGSEESPSVTSDPLRYSGKKAQAAGTAGAETTKPASP